MVHVAKLAVWISLVLPAFGHRVSLEGELEAVDAENDRKGTLFFLKSIRTNNAIPRGRTVISLAKDAALAGKYANELATATPAIVGKNMASIANQDSLLSKVVESGKELLRMLLDSFGGDAGEKAFEWLTGQMPSLVANFMSSAFQHLMLGLDVYGIGKNLFNAARAAHDHFKTQHLADGIKSGIPKEVIESVRDQIKAYGLDGLSAAVQDALVVGLSVGVPAVGSIVGLIKSIFDFIITAFVHFHDMWKLDGVIEQAKNHWQAKLYTDAKAFRKWYVEVIKDMPILSSYCLAMPMTGSYFGFLAMVGKDGKALTPKELKTNHDLFERVKASAKSFIGDHSVKLKSDDPMVMQSIKLARGETVTVE